jgi:hypothetical protein
MGCDTKLRGKGDLIAVPEAVVGAKPRPDLECYEECVWVEITVTDDRNLLIGNHYFARDITNYIIKTCFISFTKYVRYFILSLFFSWGF